MANETLERFCDFRLGGGIDKQLRYLIRKIVAGGSVYAPITAECFGTSEDFFRQHVNGAPVPR
jgi:hypothetical protein